MISAKEEWKLHSNPPVILILGAVNAMAEVEDRQTMQVIHNQKIDKQ